MPPARIVTRVFALIERTRAARPRGAWSVRPIGVAAVGALALALGCDRTPGPLAPREQPSWQRNAPATSCADCLLLEDTRALRAARVRADSADAMVDLGAFTVAGGTGERVLVDLSASADILTALPAGEALLVSVGGGAPVAYPLASLSQPVVVHTFDRADTVSIRYRLTTAMPRAVPLARLALTQRLSGGGAVVARRTPWVRSTSSGATVSTAALASDCRVTQQTETVCGTDVQVNPWAPADGVGGSFQSQSGTGVQSDIAVTFATPVKSVTVTIYDPTYAGNTVEAYGAGGELLGSASFAYSGQPGTNIPDTKTVSAPGITRLLLKAAPAEYVAYDLSILPSTAQRLHVIRGEGVVGTPDPTQPIPTGDPSVTLYEGAATVTGDSTLYQFAPAPGYRNVEVRLDGRPVADTGYVRTPPGDTVEHLLQVTADRVVTVPTGAGAVYDAARNVLSAPDPVPAYQQYLDAVVAYAGSTPEDPSIERDLNDVGFLVFDPVTRWDDIQRVDSLLNGHVFRLGPAVPGEGGVVLAAQPALSVASTAPIETTAMMYVNGIWTSDEDARNTLRLLNNLRKTSSRLGAATNWLPRYVYNRTRSEGYGTPGARRDACMRYWMSHNGRYGFGDNSLGRFMDECTTHQGQYMPLYDSDLGEAVRQVVEILTNTNGAVGDAPAVADRIQLYHSLGYHVITVPHSQGNLMVNQALNLLANDGRYVPSRDSTCIGVVSLASPVSKNWRVPTANFRAAVRVNGDLVPSLGLSSDVGHDNALSLAVDAVAKRIESGSSLVPAMAAYAQLYRKIHGASTLHSVDNSYLGTPESRALVVQGLESVYSACAVSSLRLNQTAVTIKRAAQLALTATPANAYGDVLAPRPTTWTSSDTRIATVDGRGLVTAKAAGTATITARYGAFSSSASLTVTNK